MIPQDFINGNSGLGIAAHEAVGLASGAFVGLGGEKEGERHDVFGGLDPLAGILEDGAGALGVGLCDAFGEDGAGDELVDADVVLPQLLGEYTDQHGESGFRRRIGRLAGPAAMAKTGAYGDDLSGPALLEVGYSRAGGVVGADEVDPHGVRPLLGAAALDVVAVVEVATRIDDDDIDSAELAGCSIKRVDDGVMVRDVGLYGDRSAAVALDVGDGAVDLGLCPGDTAYGGACVGKSGGDGLADSPSRAGDEGHLAGEGAVDGWHVGLLHSR